MTIAFLNNEYLPLEDAKISVLDRGFLFADGIYEAIPVFNRKLFRFRQHLTRLKRSLNAIRIELPFDEHALEEMLLGLVARNEGKDQYIYLQVTRGSAPVRNHYYENALTPTVFAYSSPFTTHPVEELRRGISAITCEDLRWKRCDIKAISLLPNFMARQEAHEQNVAEAILIKDGYAMEGSASNLFIVKDNVIRTTPLGPHILGGITRDLILELAKKNDMPYEELMIPEADLYSADEVWLSASGREIQPVLKINDKTIANGVAGPTWEKMITCYQNYKLQY